MLLCLVFLWKRFVLSQLLAGKREEKGVSYRLRFVSSARKRQSNTSLFHLHHSPRPPLSLRLFLPLAVKVLQYSTSTDHLVAVLVWPSTKWKRNIKIFTQRWNPPFNTLTLSCYIILPWTCLTLLYFSSFSFLKDIFNITNKLGLSLFLSIKCGRMSIWTCPASQLICNF